MISIKTSAAAFAFIFAILAVPASAQSLVTGQCLTAASVRAALMAESQNPVIIGNRSGYGYPTALIFMSNADGSRGYALRGDKPLGQQAETICVEAVYRDVRLNDITKPGVPAWAMMPNTDPKAADAVCKRDRLGYQELCNFHNGSLVGLEKNGQRVMFVATGTAINPRDKSVRENQRITVTINFTEQGGLVKAATPEGASYMLSAYSKVSYTQFGNALLGR